MKLSDLYIWIMSHFFPISPGQLWQSKELGTIITVTAIGKFYVSFTIWKMQSRRRIYGAPEQSFAVNISYFFDIDPSDEEEQQRRYTAAAAKWLSQVLAEMRNLDSSFVNYEHMAIKSRTVEIASWRK